MGAQRKAMKCFEKPEGRGLYLEESLVDTVMYDNMENKKCT